MFANLVTWVTAHWADIASTVAASLLLADKVAFLTPWKWDDDALKNLEGLLKGLGFVKVEDVTPASLK